MIQTGVVKKTYKSTADVEVIRSAACGESCAACGLCPAKEAVVSAINEIGAAAGDTVIINMSDKKVLGAAFLVYIVPLVFLIAGYFIGYSAFKTELSGIISGFALMVLVFPLIILIDRKIKRRYMPNIVRIAEA